MSGERKAFIVFRGTPEVFYVPEEGGTGYNALVQAEEYAAEHAADNEEAYTIMCVTHTDLDTALVAEFRGVVIRKLTERI